MECVSGKAISRSWILSLDVRSPYPNSLSGRHMTQLPFRIFDSKPKVQNQKPQTTLNPKIVSSSTSSTKHTALASYPTSAALRRLLPYGSYETSCTPYVIFGRMMGSIRTSNRVLSISSKDGPFGRRATRCGVLRS